MILLSSTGTHYVGLLSRLLQISCFFLHWPSLIWCKNHIQRISLSILMIVVEVGSFKCQQLIELEMMPNSWIRCREDLMPSSWIRCLEDLMPSSWIRCREDLMPSSSIRCRGDLMSWSFVDINFQDVPNSVTQSFERFPKGAYQPLASNVSMVRMVFRKQNNSFLSSKSL